VSQVIFSRWLGVGVKARSLSLSSPYIKGLPITATVVERKANGDHSEELIRPTYEDAYTLEYKALYNAIVNGTEVRNGPLDAKEDLEIFMMIMDVMIWVQVL
jgi:hypothetical protein